MTVLRKIEKTHEFISSLKISRKSDTAVILGSGLGDLGEEIEDAQSVPYKEIPHFPVSTVEGHKGNLIFGNFGNRNVVAMQGRFHYYEGHSMEAITYPVRIFKRMGIKYLLVSNAAGGVNKEFKTGDLMLITDHINLFPEHPLRGKNPDSLGPRFPAMTNAYSSRLGNIARKAAESLCIELKEGIYAGLQGPSFETPAEYNWLRIIGADAVGMSTVPEIIVARHMAMECMGISVITNSTATREEIKTDHEEVQTVGRNSTPRMTALFREIISQLS